MFRGGTVALIYRHALDLSSGCFEESAAVTLMSTDVNRVILSHVELNERWARLIEVVVGLTLLAHQFGWVCVVPIVVLLGTLSSLRGTLKPAPLIQNP